MDITSLYTVIPNGEGLLALKHFFDLHRLGTKLGNTSPPCWTSVNTEPFFIRGQILYKSMAWPCVPKWDPATPIFSWAALSTNFSINTTAPNLNSTVATLTTVSALFNYQRRTQSIYNCLQFVHPTLNLIYLGNFRYFLSIYEFQLKSAA